MRGLKEFSVGSARLRGLFCRLGAHPSRLPHSGQNTGCAHEAYQRGNCSLAWSLMVRKPIPGFRNLDQDSALVATLQKAGSRMVAAPVSVVADVPEKFSGPGQLLVAEAQASSPPAAKRKSSSKARISAEQPVLLENGGAPGKRSEDPHPDQFVGIQRVLVAQAGYARHRNAAARRGGNELNFGTTASRAGFLVFEVRGGHHLLQNPDGRRTVVPVHAGEIIGPVCSQKS